MMNAEIDGRAREANSRERWDRLWASEGDATWRQHALAEVYDRIAHLVPQGAWVLDLGGGIGILGAKLRLEKQCVVTVWDISEEAIQLALDKGLAGEVVDLSTPGVVERVEAFCRHLPIGHDRAYVVATEVFEHLPGALRERLVKAVAAAGACLLASVPNDRLGPEIEPQHTVQLTAMEFLDTLRGAFSGQLRGAPREARVECLGPVAQETRAPAFLLGVAGDVRISPRPKLTVTLPVRDEADDLALTLATFRAVADEIVVGVDPRTKDATREVARRYADVVFELKDPRGQHLPDAAQVPENGVHFAWIRNQCIERCSGDFIFMTEGHEHLHKGVDTLLRLGELLPPGTKVGYVWRTGQGQRWGYPWLFANDTRLRFIRHTHNQLEIPGGVLEVRLPQVETLHRRSHANKQAREKQRVAQNRRTLLDDWVRTKNYTSLYYLANETRDWDQDRAMRRMREFLDEQPKNGAARYQTRLVLAADLAQLNKLDDARAVLVRAAEDDWSRSEHYMWLGDLAFERERYEEALRWYLLLATGVGNVPFTLMWLDEDVYQYLPAQRLAMAYAALGRLHDARQWAARLLDLLPPTASDEMLTESRENLQLLDNAINGAST